MNNNADLDKCASTVTATIVSALNQSQALLQQVQRQTKRIDQLARENARLRLDAEAARASRTEVLEQLDHNFRIGAERLAEIDQLKRKLHALQNRERSVSAQSSRIPPPRESTNDVLVPSSSPLSSTHRKHRQQSSRDETVVPASRVLIEASPPHKKARICSPSAQEFQELMNEQTPKRRFVGKDRSNRGAEAIPLITEDDEYHQPKRRHGGTHKEQKKLEGRDQRAHDRLNTLLSDPVPERCPVLPRPDQRFTKQTSSGPRTHTSPFLRSGSGNLSKDVPAPQPRPRSRFLPMKRQSLAEAEVDQQQQEPEEPEEPLRNRPVSELNLSHFKLNPNFEADGHFAPDETVRDRPDDSCPPGCGKTECCRAQVIAATLGPDAILSDDDLLMYIFGPGSEEKVRTMTAIARQNLIEDARAKRISDIREKTHHNPNQREHSPVDFWNVGMPGSQEAKKNREAARRREREEIEMRYREACRGSGQWKFRDE